uniref:G_PROTEIN_RECEP_F1_2 domain-containing protein n=1 Tax=Panagrellus redivivus TaxID=6233 RepID=A0A7E4W071_PANRE
MDSFITKFDNLNNSYQITLQSCSERITFIKNNKLLIDIVTVFYSTLLNIIVLISLPILHRGLKFHIHLRCMIYEKWVFYMLYRCANDASIILSYILPDVSEDGYSKVYAVKKALLPLSIVEIVCAAIVCGAISNIILERLLATVLINFYEHWVCYTLVATISFTVGGIFASLAFLVMLVNDGSIFVIPLLFILLVDLAIAVSYIVYKNYKLHAIRITSENRMTLSKRYQLSENLRSIKLMQAFLVTEVMCNTCNLAAFFAYLIADDFWIKLVMHYVWQWIALFFATLILVLFLGKGTKQTMKRLCRIRNNSIESHISTENPLPIKSTTNENLMLKSQQETDVYFSQLARSWS